MKIYKRRNPDWSFEVLKQHSEAVQKGEKTRGYMFVTLWQKYIDEGMAEEEAYQRVDAEFQEVESKINAEREVIEMQQLRTGTAPSMLAFQAEEDKYVAEAFAHHRTLWHARKNKSAAQAELVARKAAEPDDAAAEEDAADAKTGKKKGPKAAKKK